MANIVNANPVGLKIYRDFHPDSAEQTEDNYNVTIPDIDPDQGNMDSNLADNVGTLREVALSQKYKKSYHWNTKNKSFIELYQDLKKLGIQNNKFFLAIYDKTLMDVDPYSPILPLELQARIFKECMINPWYFLREIARIPEDGKPIVAGGGTSFRIDRNSVASWYLFLNGIDHFCSKPRQCGKTQNAICEINYAYHFGAMSASITFGNKDSTLNKMNLTRLKAQRDLLPLYLQMKLSVDVVSHKIQKGIENVTSMRNPVTGNNIMLLPIANSEMKADGLGRGFTSSIQMWDEFEWMPFNTKVIDTSVHAYNTASTNAKKNMSLYGRIFTSTPGNLDSRDGQTADEFIRGGEGSKPMLVWRDSMLDLPINKLREMVESKSYNGIVFVEHSWKQLKKSEEWYEKACRGVRYNAEQIAREINLKRLRGTSKSPFKRTDIMTMINNVDQPISTVDYSDNGCPIYFYENLDRRTRYILSVDPAEGLSGDNMAMVLINPYNEHIAAEFKSPYIHQGKMAKLVIRFMNRYCPKSLIVVENNRGRELLHALQDSVYASQLWYDSEKLESKEMVNDTYESQAQRALGFNTNTKSRPLLYNLLDTMVAEETEKINGKFVVDDICALEKNPVTGRIAAAQGKHDDMCMAYIIGLFVLRNSDLMEWGIYRGMTPPKDQTTETPKEKANKLAELASMLPENIRNLFTPTDKDPVEESWKYAKQIQQARMENDLAANKAKIFAGQYTEDDITSDYSADYAQMQNSLDDDILAMNFYDKDKDIDYSDFF